MSLLPPTQFVSRADSLLEPSFFAIVLDVSGPLDSCALSGYLALSSSSQMVVDSVKFTLAASLLDSGLDKRPSLLQFTFRKSHQNLFEVFVLVLSLEQYTLESCLHTLHHGVASFTFNRGRQHNG